MKHGGDLLTFEDQYDGDLVDFSSNINPLGPPKGLNDALINSLQDLISYPDIKYRNLKKKIAKYLKCEEENILVGNGAVEIINNFIIGAKRVVVSTPSFIEYEERAIVHGKEVDKIPYKEDFTIDLEALKDIKADDLLILGNPNNPTGLRIPQDELVEIYKIVRKARAFLLLDEAFYEFCPMDYDSVEIFKVYDYEGVGIIRAATKFFALPGIRLGYGCTSIGKVKDLSKIELPWSVNTLADAAGQYIFDHKEYIEESKAYIDNERKFLLSQLSNIEGLHPFMTHTNYILIKLEKWDEEYVFNFLLKRGLVVRKCSSFKGMDNKHIRVAIKDRANNVRLVEVFKELKD